MDWGMRSQFQSGLDMWYNAFVSMTVCQAEMVHRNFPLNMPIKSRMVSDFRQELPGFRLSHVHICCCQLVFFLRHIADTKAASCFSLWGFQSPFPLPDSWLDWSWFIAQLSPLLCQVWLIVHLSLLEVQKIIERQEILGKIREVKLLLQNDKNYTPIDMEFCF